MQAAEIEPNDCRSCPVSGLRPRIEGGIWVCYAYQNSSGADTQDVLHGVRRESKCWILHHRSLITPSELSPESAAPQGLCFPIIEARRRSGWGRRKTASYVKLLCPSHQWRHGPEAERSRQHIRNSRVCAMPLGQSNFDKLTSTIDLDTCSVIN